MCGFCVNLSIYFCLVKLYHGLTSIQYSLDKLIGPPHNFFLMVISQVSTNSIDFFY